MSLRITMFLDRANPIHTFIFLLSLSYFFLMILSPSSCLLCVYQGVHSMGTGHLQRQPPDRIHRAAAGNTAHLRTICSDHTRQGPGHFHLHPDQGRHNQLGMNLGWKCHHQGQVQGLLPGGPAQSVRVKNQARTVLYSLGVWLMTWAWPLEKTHHTRHLDSPKKAEGGQQERMCLELGTGAGGPQWGRGWQAETSERRGDVASGSKMRSRWSCHWAAAGCCQLPAANSTHFKVMMIL